MQRLLHIFLLVLLWGSAGCGSTGAGGSAGSAPPTVGKAPPAPRLDEQVSGRVVLVNVPLRYAVMDFPVERIPQLDQRLGVYRQDQKVGEIKVTGPIMDTSVAGDLVAGEAQVGDEVRTH